MWIVYLNDWKDRLGIRVATEEDARRLIQALWEASMIYNGPWDPTFVGIDEDEDGSCPNDGFLYHADGSNELYAWFEKEDGDANRPHLH